MPKGLMCCIQHFRFREIRFNLNASYLLKIEIQRYHKKLQQELGIALLTAVRSSQKNQKHVAFFSHINGPKPGSRRPMCTSALILNLPYHSEIPDSVGTRRGRDADVQREGGREGERGTDKKRVPTLLRCIKRWPAENSKLLFNHFGKEMRRIHRPHRFAEQLRHF